MASSPAQLIRQKANHLKNIINLCDKDLSSVLPPHVSLDRLKEVFILNCKQTPKLLECDEASLIKAVYTCASMGLEPDPNMGQIYILPYGSNAQVIPGYKGLVKLVRNSGDVVGVYSGAVREHDEYDYNLGSDPFVKHKPSLKGDRGDILFFYCAATMKDGSKHVEIMTKDEVDRVKNMSSAVKSGRQTPWNDHYEEMGKKTVFRRAYKMLPVSTSRQLSTAIAIDNAEYEGRVAYADQDGEVIEVEPEAPTQSGESSQLNSFNQEKKEQAS